MTDRPPRAHPSHRHELLVHDDDVSLVRATREFALQGLAAGGDVLVHSSREKVPMLQDELGDRPRLSYGYDEDLYEAPTRTLFAYQRQLAARKPGSRELWVTGTVPLGTTRSAQAAWARYESAVNEALGPFPFHALCTYDTRERPAHVVAAARATHPLVELGLGTMPSAYYRPPARFLGHALAEVPQAPRTAPQLVTVVRGVDDLGELRNTLQEAARSATAVPLELIEDLVAAVHEVALNGLVHGEPPVTVTAWTEIAQLVVEVVDVGPGGVDPLSGFRFPGGHGSLGLWTARQDVDDLFIETPASGGCLVRLITSARVEP